MREFKRGTEREKSSPTYDDIYAHSDMQYALSSKGLRINHGGQDSAVTWHITR